MTTLGPLSPMVAPMEPKLVEYNGVEAMAFLGVSVWAGGTQYGTVGLFGLGVVHFSHGLPAYV